MPPTIYIVLKDIYCGHFLTDHVYLRKLCTTTIPGTHSHMQQAKEVLFNSPGIVNFPIMLVGSLHR